MAQQVQLFNRGFSKLLSNLQSTFSTRAAIQAYLTKGQSYVKYCFLNHE